ncbi:MAG: hypothetical protein AAFR52_12555 [Pseudomonadota bacterium]
MKTVTWVSTAIAAALMTSPAYAFFGKPPARDVPEIDALAGVAAIALVGAAVALVRDRSKH